jgi:hypothetical protein
MVSDVDAFTSLLGTCIGLYGLALCFIRCKAERDGSI